MKTPRREQLLFNVWGETGLGDKPVPGPGTARPPRPQPPRHRLRGGQADVQAGKAQAVAGVGRGRRGLEGTALCRGNAGPRMVMVSRVRWEEKSWGRQSRSWARGEG